MGYNKCYWENTNEAKAKGIPSTETRIALLNPTADKALGAATPPLNINGPQESVCLKR